MDNDKNKKVVTRFAPSPTGWMHIGGVRTALFAYLWAKRNKGIFILRIEDTDKEREVEGSVEQIIESLKWIGIDWDEGPDIGGPHAPYKQSERLDIYKKYGEKLIAKGLAYPDPYTEEDLTNFREKAEIEGRAFLFRDYRPEVFEEWDGTKPLRFKVPVVKRTDWHDIVFGDLSAGEEALDDIVLIKSDGYPTYNFAHIIDDIEMNVTHVMRGQEFLPSTPKYLAIYEALEIVPPIFVTMPPILGEGGNKKLSKRDGAKSVLEFKNEGYSADALFNFLSFLGWNPGGEKEIFTKEELIQIFDIARIQKSGAQFNEEKLDWMNKEHMKNMPFEEFKERAFLYLPDELKKDTIIHMIRERVAKFEDIATMIDNKELDFFYLKPEIKEEGIIYKNTDINVIKNNIKEAIEILEKIDEDSWNKEKLKEALMDLASSKTNRGEVLHPVRYALSGLDKSPDPFIIGEVIGKNETIQRLQNCI
jgi:glutamyl-tRNA synthetase